MEFSRGKMMVELCKKRRADEIVTVIPKENADVFANPATLGKLSKLLLISIPGPNVTVWNLSFM